MGILTTSATNKLVEI